MRRTLTFLIITSALCATAMNATSQVWTPSAGITLNEKEASSTLGSRIDAYNRGRVVGSWFSSSGQLPQLVCGLRYVAHLDTSGVNKIESVKLKIDNAGSVWETTLKVEKRKEDKREMSWEVELPELDPGSHALAWVITARDQRNRLIVIIIPICWSSTRQLAATSQVMAQSAPPGCEMFDDRMWFACLRGFVAAWATPDPAYLTQMQAVRSIVQQQTAPPPSPPTDPPKLNTPEMTPSKPVGRPHRSSEYDGATGDFTQDTVDRQPEPPAKTEPRPVTLANGVTIYLGRRGENGFQLTEKPLRPYKFRALVGLGYKLRFYLNGKVAVEAEVIGFNPVKQTVTAEVIGDSSTTAGCNKILVFPGGGER